MAWGTTPATRPARPACTAATTPSSGSARRTGTQSAARATSTQPGVRVTSASASGSAAGGLSVPQVAGSTRTTSAPCTCRIDTTPRTSSPSARATSSRLRSTSGWSPGSWAVRLSSAYGPALTPPKRSVNATSTEARSSRKANTGPDRRRLLEEVGDVEVVGRLQRTAGPHRRSRHRRLRARLALGVRGARRREGGAADGRSRGDAGSPIGGDVAPGAYSRRPRLRLGLHRHRLTAHVHGGVATLGHAAVEAGRDHRDPHLVAERVVDDRTED